MIKNYSDFSKWHETNFGRAYVTPTFADVVARLTTGFPYGYSYDSEADVFWYAMGEFATNPGERKNVTWADVAKRYDSMYNDFARYGTN